MRISFKTPHPEPVEGVSSTERIMKARVFVTLKNGVLDPQGKAIGHALNGLGFPSVRDVRQGKLIELELAETDADKAKADIKAMCEKLLANTVIEKYEIELK
jgi:phosphoribosylformylglycinamidine synthase PurS subunit